MRGVYHLGEREQRLPKSDMPIMWLFMAHLPIRSPMLTPGQYDDLLMRRAHILLTRRKYSSLSATCRVSDGSQQNPRGVYAQDKSASVTERLHALRLSSLSTSAYHQCNGRKKK